MSTHVIKQLAQSRPAGTAAVSIYSPGANVEAAFRILVCNNTNAPAKYSIFVDDDGTTYDESTALAFEQEIGANETVSFPPSTDKIAMNNEAGNLAVQTDVGDAITFTVNGDEVDSTVV